MDTHSERFFALCLLLSAPVLGQESRPRLALPTELVGFTSDLAKAKVPPANPSQRVAYSEALVQRANEQRFVLASCAKALGDGVGPAFQLVRERIRFESYSGVMRGAELCFAARAGNALDRCLVLSELLRAKGIATRFVRGKLPRDRAEALVDRMFAKDLAPAQPAPTGDVQRSSLPERVLERARRDYGSVRSALKDKLVAAALPSREDLVSEVEQHFWVQARQGQDWIDLDSAFADGQVGRALTKPEQIYPNIPEELHQHVTFRIVTESVVNGAVVEKVELAVATKSEEVIDAQVLLAHVVDSGNRALGNKIAGKSASWRPVLWIGEQSHTGEGVDFGLAARGEVVDALSNEPPPVKPSPFVAEQLEIEVTFPDGRSDVVRRALTDRAGPAWRLSGGNDITKLAPVATDERGPIDAQAVHCILASGGKHDLHGYAQAVHLLATELLAEHEAAQAAIAAGRKEDRNSQQAATGDDSLAMLWPFYLQNLGWMIWSDHYVVPALDDVEGLRCYVDSPRIWISSMSILGDDLKVTFDLRRDKVRVVAKDPDSQGLAAAERKLWFALLEGALEHEAMAERGAVMAEADVTIETTSASLTKAGVRVLGSADVDVAREIATKSPKKGSYLRLALERGALVVVPRGVLEAGEAAWWEIDARGNARAVYGEDWNGAMLQGGGLYRGGGRSARVGGELPRGSMTRGGGRGAGGGVYNPPKPVGKSAPKTSQAKGGGGELGEYINIVLSVPVPTAYAWFAVGLGVESAALFVGAAIIEESSR